MTRETSAPDGVQRPSLHSVITMREAVSVGDNSRQWASRIQTAWQTSVESIFICGRLLIDSKANLAHGDFQNMVTRHLPFGPPTARKLMAIANDTRLANRAHVRVLPPHWGTLYELTKLSDESLAEKLSDGTVHPEMQRRDVAGVNYAFEQARDELRVKNLTPVVGRYRTLVIDPPWESGGGRALSYATMSQLELLEMPVPQWADDNCHMYLWATNGEIPNALQLMKHWGFEYKTDITWVKSEWSMGHYFRSKTEHALFGVRGTIRTRAAARSIPTCFEASVGEHSEKPEEFYRLVRSASYPPYAEAFQRRARQDFLNLYQSKAPLVMEAA